MRPLARQVPAAPSGVTSPLLMRGRPPHSAPSWQRYAIGVAVLGAVAFWAAAVRGLVYDGGGAASSARRQAADLWAEDIDWKHCADEGAECACGGSPGAVRYGSGASWELRRLCKGERSIPCKTRAFSNVDPSPGRPKRCECTHDPAVVGGTGPCAHAGCHDQYEEKCVDWAKRGECEMNPGMMLTGCSLSCGVCGGGHARQMSPAEQKTFMLHGPRGSTVIHKTGPIADQVKLMEAEPVVDPKALVQNRSTMVNPAPWACNHTGDITERMMRKVTIASPAAAEAAGRLMCLVYTMADRKEAIAAIRESWGPDCDGLLFFSTQTDPATQQIKTHHLGDESYHNMWQKSRSIWAYVAAQERKGLPQYEWFIIGGDDLYIVANNLKAYVATLPNATAKPHFLGRRFHAGGINFNSGGAGYALNRPAVLLLGARLDLPECDPHYRHFSEDREVASCLRLAGVYPADTRDALKEERFMPFHPQLHYRYRKEDNLEDWYWQYTYDMKSGMESMSKEVVTWHYLKPKAIRRMHALLRFCPLPMGDGGVLGWQHCADEGDRCSCRGEVRFGSWMCAGGEDDGGQCYKFVTRQGPFNGSCLAVNFNRVDPTPGYVKSCMCHSSK
eukprot:TRINITY_DN66157_c0_g1_i1.p1 TRINITY_DN66157_c0_g1~~TRINITY_DN66157_c0_g1_i1.p1  ORF type:complete len:616 (+),score=183.27 TRINITY_DN66157_c0_g1_i1:79-1926(+)